MMIEGERVNSRGNIPRYIPKGPRELTPIQRNLIKLIPFYPDSISTVKLAHELKSSAATVSQALSTDFCITYLICEDEKKNISRCNPL